MRRTGRASSSSFCALDAAFNLARWLLKSRADCEDVAQEAMLRAYRFFRGFHGGDARAWLLQIVRNTCYTWLEKNRPVELMTEFDEELHPQPSASPEALAIAGADASASRAPSKLCPPASAKSSSFANSKAALIRKLLALLHPHWHCDVRAGPRSSASPAGATHASPQEASREL